MTISQTTIDALQESGKVDSVEQMMQHLFQWHSAAVSSLDHFETIPHGTEVSTESGKVLLVGDSHAAFTAGINIGQILLAKLPFEARYLDENGQEIPLEKIVTAKPTSTVQ